MTTALDRILVGVGPPHALTIQISPSSSVPDLSVVTAGSIRVRRPDRTTATWSCAITSQAANALTLRHVFASGDVPTPGRYQLAVDLTVPGGTVTCEPISLRADAAV